MKRKILTVTATVLAVTLAVSGSAYAFDSVRPVMSGSVTAEDAVPGMPWQDGEKIRGFGFRINGGTLDKAAEMLGIMKEELIAKMEDGKTLNGILEENGLLEQYRQYLLDEQKAALDEAVKNGKITQEIADDMLERFTNDNFNFDISICINGDAGKFLDMPEFGSDTEVSVQGGNFLFGEFPDIGKHGGGYFNFSIDPLGKAAELLGVTQEELISQLKDGKALSEILEEKGLLEQYRQYLIDEQKAALDEAVKNGKITQETADSLLERFTAEDFDFDISISVNGRSGKFFDMPELGADIEMPGSGEWFSFNELPDRGKGGDERFNFNLNHLEKAAEILGITQEELTEQLKDGKTLNEFLEEKGLLEQYRQSLLDEQKTALDEAVKNGSITQETADSLLEMFEKMNEFENGMFSNMPGMSGLNGRGVFGNDITDGMRFEINTDDVIQPDVEDVLSA